jgi:glycosyltransferase involved in cell wall biosynthesis
VSADAGLVSIVVPTYNRAATCRDAVRSVLEQSYARLEVIVVDDGSQDDTRARVAGLDRRVRYIHQDNAGAAAARNRGIDEARGEFVGFLDSDDVFRSWKLEAQVSVLRAFPEAGMAWTDMAAMDPDGRPLHEAYNTRMYGAYRHLDRAALLLRGRPLHSIWPGCPADLAARRCVQADLGAQLFLGNLIPTPSVLLRRERLRAVGGFDPRLQRTGEDYDFHYRVCRAGPVVYMDVSSFVYRIGAADQLTAARHHAWMARNTLATVAAAWREADGRIPLPAAVVRRRLAAVHRWVSRVELFEDPAAARRHALAALAWEPWPPRAAGLLAAALLPRRSLVAALRARRACRRWLAGARAELHAR